MKRLTIFGLLVAAEFAFAWVVGNLLNPTGIMLVPWMILMLGLWTWFYQKWDRWGKR